MSTRNSAFSLFRFPALLAGLCWLAVGPPVVAEVPMQKVEVLQRLPHDSQAFTQGLVFADGKLYEGTGRNGESSLRLVDLESGEILKRHNLPSRYFGEGITVFDGRIYQLTWRANTGFVYDQESFELLDTFYLAGEGWGLTDDGERLIVSDGSANLRFLDPETLNETGRVQVHDDQGPVTRLNELEFIAGEVWANVWYEDHIVRIDPASGRVTGRLDLSGLYRSRGRDDVLNGIAWDERKGRLFVTGKLWPWLYEIKVLD